MNQERGNKFDSREWYCHLHGKGNHSTKFCKIVKELESIGWVRKQKNAIVREVQNSGFEDVGLNKKSSCY
jgi:hypothetical protein